MKQTRQKGVIKLFISTLLLLLILNSTVYAKELDINSLKFTPVTKSDVGVVIYDIAAGKNILSINQDKPFFYASNLKLLTAAAAIEYLGGGFHFMTLFLFDKKSGTLFLKSAGDPSMVMEDLWHISRELKIKGISGIKQIVVDDFFYGKAGYRKILGGGNGDNAYLAYVSPLSLNYNSVEIVVTPSEIGKKVNAFVSTPSYHFKVTNSAVTEAGGENRLIIGTRKSGKKTEIIIKGSLGSGRKRAVRVYKKVYSPTHHYIDTLLQMMGEKSTIPVKRQKIASSKFTKYNGALYIHKSAPLRDILRSMNRYSSNFLAECIQIFMGAVIKGNVKEGVNLLKKYAKENLSEDVEIINGSGLGNGRNSFKPSFFIKLLKHIYNDPYYSIDFFSSLPVVGEDGTLKKVDSGYSGMVRGKTGTLTSVSALSGLMKGRSGKLYIFTFTVNNYPHKSFKKMWKFRDRFIAQIWEEL